MTLAASLHPLVPVCVSHKEEERGQANEENIRRVENRETCSLHRRREFECKMKREGGVGDPEMGGERRLRAKREKREARERIEVGVEGVNEEENRIEGLTEQANKQQNAPRSYGRTAPLLMPSMKLLESVI